MRRPSPSSSLLALGACALLVTGCAGRDERPTTPSRTDVPGPRASAEAEALWAGMAAVQAMDPVRDFDAHLSGFHFVNGDPDRQVESHYFVQQVNADFWQALLYDGDGEDAKLVGVEYLISERLFRTLPAEEQRLWHSHGFEVAAGTLVAPGAPAKAERALMEEVATTYGKTIYLWSVDRGDTLPLGAPALMMAPTATGQIDERLIEERDRRLGLSTDAVRRRRSDIVVPPPQGEADAWQRGEVVQFGVTSGAGGAEQSK